jgi:DNA-binding transcriptional LysR family regulator
VALADLADESFLLPGHSLNMSNLLMDACRRAGLSQVPYRANYLELSKALVRQELGVAFMPQMFLQPGTMDGLAAISLKEPLTRDLELIYSNERSLSVAARTLALHIKTGIQELQGATGSAATRTQQPPT